MKSPAHLTVKTRDSTAMVVWPGHHADVSMDYTQIEVTLSPSKLAEIRFPTTGKVGAGVGGFSLANNSEGHFYKGVLHSNREQNEVTSMVWRSAHNPGGAVAAASLVGDGGNRVIIVSHFKFVFDYYISTAVQTIVYWEMKGFVRTFLICPCVQPFRLVQHGYLWSLTRMARRVQSS